MMCQAKGFEVKRQALALVIVFFITTLHALSQTVKLGWEPSPDPNAVGYKIYYGTTSHNYSSTVNVGNTTNTTLTGFINGRTYFFAATTYDAANQESGFSNEASYAVPQIATNQIPTLNTLGNLVLNQNTGTQSVALTGISSGSPNENQTLTVTSVSSNPALIPNPIVIYNSPNSTGSLTFTPVSNVTGTNIITVTVNDGGTSNNIITRSFTVTVKPVNQMPTLNALNNLVVNQNSGAQSVALTGITSGSPNENQNLTVTTVSSNPALIPNPIVTYSSPNTTGSLTFTPISNVTGTNIITVTVNDGGTSNNIITRSFTVIVNPFAGEIGITNHPPTLNLVKDKITIPSSVQQAVSLSGISSGDPTQNQKLKIKAVSGNRILVPNPSVSYTSPKSTGTLKFVATPNLSGNTAVTVTVSDDGAPNRIVTQTFIINVVGSGLTLPGKPSIKKFQMTNSAVAGQNLTFSVTATGTGPLKYQWKLDGNDLTSETNSVLNISQVSTNQSGKYSVIVFNSRGAVKSAANNLIVTPNPGIAKAVQKTPIASMVLLTPTSYAYGQFSFNVSGISNYPCIVQTSTNLVDWISVETNLTPFIFTDYNAGQFSHHFYRTVGK